MYSAGNISNEIKTNDNKKEIPYRSSQNFQSNRRQNINNTAWQINKQQNQDIIKATTTNIKHHNIRPSTTTSNVQQQQQQQRQEYLKQKRNDTTNFAYNLQHYDKKEIDLKNFEISCGYKREFYDDNMKRKSSSVLIEANNKQITFDLLRNITQRGKPLYDKQLTFLKDDSTPHHTHKNSSSTRTLFTVASDAEYNNIHEGRKLKKVKKKYRKFLFPLLMAYKLKFFTLIPVLIAGLTLLVTTTGLAGFFFALFTAVMTLRGTGGGGGKAVVVQEY
uniref:Uncharacterized protein n=1 Tax=Glossina brevipalpis TaxID=37001 RepID=A0A1A9W5N1_9MUSC